MIDYDFLYRSRIGLKNRYSKTKFLLWAFVDTDKIDVRDIL